MMLYNHQRTVFQSYTKSSCQRCFPDVSWWTERPDLRQKAYGLLTFSGHCHLGADCSHWHPHNHRESGFKGTKESANAKTFFGLFASLYIYFSISHQNISAIADNISLFSVTYGLHTIQNRKTLYVSAHSNGVHP